MNNVTCARDESAPSILIEDHPITDTQNIETIVDPVIINPLPAENKPYSSELLIIYIILILLVAFTLYQHLRYRRMMHYQLNELDKLKKLNASFQKPQGATAMNPINSTIKTGDYHPLSPSEMINPPDNSVFNKASSRKPFNGGDGNISVGTPETKSIEIPQQAKTQKEEVAENKFSYDERINFRHEMEKLNRQIKREHQENRDNFAAFAKENLELKKGLESLVIGMSQFTYNHLIGEDREKSESYVRSLNSLLTEWKNILEDYNIVEILPAIGEDYKKHEKFCKLEKESIDTSDPQKNETIAKVLEKGYRLESRLLYPASVCIYKYKPVAQSI